MGSWSASPGTMKSSRNAELGLPVSASTRRAAMLLWWRNSISRFTSLAMHGENS